MVADLIWILPLPLGVAGHEGSTVVVGLNGLRLLRSSVWRRAARRRAAERLRNVLRRPMRGADAPRAAQPRQRWSVPGSPWSGVSGGGPGGPAARGCPTRSARPKDARHAPAAALLPPPLASLLAAAGAVVALGTTLGPVSVATAATPSAAVGATAGAAATGPVVPAAPAGLPAGMEALAAYVPAVSCDSTDKPGSTSLGALLEATYPGTTYAVSRPCGSDVMSTTEHYDGRAVDWFTNVRTPEGKARGDALVNWLTATDARGNVAANARRLGVMYIIWNNRIWGAYRPADGWRPYLGCAGTPSPASDTTCHRNHVHLSLSWAGAMGRTSWWTRTVAGTGLRAVPGARPELGTRLHRRQPPPVPVLPQGQPRNPARPR